MRFFNREVLEQRPNSDRSGFIPPCGTYEFEFEVPQRDFPVTHALRLAGETDYFWKYRCESGSSYAFGMTVDDALSTADSYQETYALAVDCRGELYERNAWIKLFHDDFFPEVLPEERKERNIFRFSVPVKKTALTIPEGEKVAAVMELYRAKPGRHVNDTFDAPDQTVSLDVTNGTAGWEVLETEFDLPADTCAILINIHIGKGVNGKIRFGSPRFIPEGKDNIVPPLAPTQARMTECNYVADNFSRRDHLEFRCEIDGKCVFNGQKYTSILRRMDHEFAVGKLAPGRHKAKITLQNDYENAIGFVLMQLDLIEYGNHDFEIVAFHDYVEENAPCRVLVRTAKDNVIISDGKISHIIEKAGLNALKLAPLTEAEKVITLTCGNFSDSFTVKQVPAVTNIEEKLYLSTGDSIFIPREIDEMERFIEWYCGNKIGNTVCFRQSYRWGGCRYVNGEMWTKILSLLQDYGIYYFLMVDGRELPGCNANPPEELMQSEYYLGRQSHENDGSLDYWSNHMWRDEALPEPYADLLAKRVDFGGIQPHIRPKRKGSQGWWFYDPTLTKDMKEASGYFISNLTECKGESTRHSGPSTFFRYFFQAGYDFLISEQMYGPEELTLASLRAASAAYHAKGFGSHLATQWSSIPHDTLEHAERYYLALATCYIQGVTQINTEEGLWRMEKGYADHDRFSHNSLIHREAHQKFRHFMETHPRRGKIVVPVACIQGRYDSWNARVAPAWYKHGDPQWARGEAEESFELLKLFYPRNKIDWIYRCPCPVAPQGWYTGTPYGPVDLLPFEGDWKNYRAIIFLGWHTYIPGDGDKMLDYVKDGGTLLLSKRHLSASLIHNGEGVYASDAALDELLGSQWLNASGVITRTVGKGEVIFFADDCYPAAVAEAYTARMKAVTEKAIAPEFDKLWAKGNDDVNFAVYETADGARTIYALNINWWEHQASTIEITENGSARTVELAASELVEL